MIKPILFYILLIIAIPIFSFGQDSLNLKACLAIGLEKNYSLQISRNDESITKNNLNFAKYAFFPTVDASGRKTNSVVNSRQEFASGSIQEKDNAKSNSITGAIALNWTVFDGFGMFVGFDKVKELSELGKLNTRMTIENLTAQIASGYYNLIQQTQILQSLRHGMKLSSERLAIASEKYKIGSFSKLEFLQAQVDF
jgi:outer membrane protein TolC